MGATIAQNIVMNELPASMQARPQFILCKLVPSKTKPGKMDKYPVDYRTARIANAHNPDIWMDAETAISTARLFGSEYRVGFVFAGKDPFFFLDIDNCLLADGVTWSPLALELIGMLPGAAIEVSQSGRGLHVFGSYSGEMPDHACKNIQLGIELYHKDRFVLLTGTNAIGDASTDCTDQIQLIISKFFQPRIASTPEKWTTEPVPEWNGLEDDDDLIHKALQSKSAAAAFGTRASFADLWNCNVDVLARVFPPDASDKGLYDESSADMALAQHLAFWTGKNCERIERLMWRSGLVRDHE